MKRILILFSFIISVCSSVAYADTGVTWVSLQEGQQKAKAEKKAMIIDFFFGPECPRCASLQKEVYDNPVIARKIMSDFIPIRIDLTKKMTKDEEALGDKYEFKNDCLLLFMNFEGTLIKDQKGKKLCFIDKVDPEEFVSYLDHIKKTYEKALEKKAP